jgi:hypothetical protein
MFRRLIAGVIAVAVVGTACTSSAASSNGSSSPASAEPQVVASPTRDGAYHPDINPANFVSVIDNPYFPLTPGTSYTFEGVRDGAGQRDVFTVTGETKPIMGVTSTVIKDTATVLKTGTIIEVTSDWFAQDNQGNVWYMGEDTKLLNPDGSVKSTAGSWTGGVDGALPGIVMPGDLQIPSTFKQEYYPGQAEDSAWFVSKDQSAKVPYKTLKGGVVETLEWSPLEPEVIEKKYYAAGIGLVYSVSAAGEVETAKLVSVTHA